jgi:hypothetical protein
VNQSNGTWNNNAADVPGTSALNAGRVAQVSSVSCGSARNCGAGGYYTDGSGHRQAFRASQVNRNWHAATEVPGTAALNAGGNAQILSVSCRSAGASSDCGRRAGQGPRGSPTAWPREGRGRLAIR